MKKILSPFIMTAILGAAAIATSGSAQARWVGGHGAGWHGAGWHGANWHGGWGGGWHPGPGFAAGAIYDAVVAAPYGYSSGYDNAVPGFTAGAIYDTVVAAPYGYSYGYDNAGPGFTAGAIYDTVVAAPYGYSHGYDNSTHYVGGYAPQYEYGQGYSAYGSNCMLVGHWEPGGPYWGEACY